MPKDPDAFQCARDVGRLARSPLVWREGSVLDSERDLFSATHRCDGDIALFLALGGGGIAFTGEMVAVAVVKPPLYEEL